MVTGVIFIVVAVAAALSFLVSSGTISPASNTPTNTPQPEQHATDTPEIDEWSATGTALYLQTVPATIDYCFWLTPTPTFTPTLPYTPDAWQATGTAIYEATFPPILPTNTPDVPRAWCNNIPSPTPTLTPLSLGMVAEPTKAAATNKPPPTRAIVNNNPPGLVGNNAGWHSAPPALAPAVVENVIPLPTSSDKQQPTKTHEAAIIAVTSAYCVYYPEFLVSNTGGKSGAISWAIMHEQSGLYASLGTVDKIHAGASVVFNAPAALEFGRYTLYLNNAAVQSVDCLPPEKTAEAAP
jgi:hypothetical protein